MLPNVMATLLILLCDSVCQPYNPLPSKVFFLETQIAYFYYCSIKLNLAETIKEIGLLIFFNKAEDK